MVEACDGSEALRIIEEIRPNVVLLDIGMPVLDGFAVVRAIRENPRLATLPVLAVTAYAMQGDRQRVLSSGFDGYIAKPIDAKSLGEELERLLHKDADRNAAPKPEIQPSCKQEAASASGDDNV